MEEEPPKKRGGFQPGHPRYGSTMPRGAKPSDSLSAARYVSREPKVPGERGLRKMYRGLQESDPEKFLAALRVMEREHHIIKARLVGESKAAGVDAGSDTSVALCETWLKEQHALPG